MTLKEQFEKDPKNREVLIEKQISYDDSDYWKLYSEWLENKNRELEKKLSIYETVIERILGW